jgi:hypothetical protein
VQIDTSEVELFAFRTTGPWPLHAVVETIQVACTLDLATGFAVHCAPSVEDPRFNLYRFRDCYEMQSQVAPPALLRQIEQAPPPDVVDLARQARGLLDSLVLPPWFEAGRRLQAPPNTIVTIRWSVNTVAEEVTRDCGPYPDCDGVPVTNTGKLRKAAVPRFEQVASDPGEAFSSEQIPAAIASARDLTGPSTSVPHSPFVALPPGPERERREALLRAVSAPLATGESDDVVLAVMLDRAVLAALLHRADVLDAMRELEARRASYPPPAKFGLQVAVDNTLRSFDRLDHGELSLDDPCVR